jgi:hypothetical protein
MTLLVAAILPLNVMCADANNSVFLIIDTKVPNAVDLDPAADIQSTSKALFTRSGIQPTIYHTRGKHANNYTTDDVRGMSVISSILNFTIILMNYQENVPELGDMSISGLWFPLACTMQIQLSELV